MSTATATKPRHVIQVARSYIDTPFRHQGRTPGKTGELDCVGLIVCSLKSLGYPIQDFRAYGQDVDRNELLRQLGLYFDLKPDKSIAMADVLVFWLIHRTIPQHVAFATGEGTMIHAYAGGKVREERIENPNATELNWIRRLYQVYSLRAA